MRILPVLGHKNFVWSAIVAVAVVAVLGATGTAEAQYRRGRVVVAPRVIVGPRVVVGGAYFYDPWFDPFYGAYDFQYPVGPYGPYGGYPVYGGYRYDVGA